MLSKLVIEDFENSEGKVQDIILSYQTFGQPLEEAPIVLVNHALTGNSGVCGEQGWWKELIGDWKSIDTRKYAVLAFNMPGNGFQEREENLLHNFWSCTLQCASTQSVVL